MKALLQRVKRASVSVDEKTIGSCTQGYMILLGVEAGDTEEDADVLAQKIGKLRVFNDEHGKMNRSILDVGGSALVVSQFTLCADYRHGNRPNYLEAARPEIAQPLYLHFVSQLRLILGNDKVQTGVFGADMCVDLSNDGPVTIMLESAVLRGNIQG